VFIFLIDISGSMAELLADEASSGIHFRLEAAVAIILETIRSLDAGTPLLLVTFNHDTSIIFEGYTNQADEIERILSGLRAWGNTSLSTALRLMLPKAGGKDKVIIVTDGDIDWHQSSPLLDNLSSGGVTVDFINIVGKESELRLHEPFQEGIRQSQVRSVSELAQAIKPLASSKALSPSQENATTVERIPRDVCFTGSYPDEVRPMEWYPLWLRAYELESIAAEIKHAMEESATLGLSVAHTTSAAMRIPEGTVIRIEPRGDEFEFDIIALEFKWTGRSSRHRLNLAEFGWLSCREAPLHFDIEILSSWLQLHTSDAS
jgi:hypothetical protein